MRERLEGHQAALSALAVLSAGLDHCAWATPHSTGGDSAATANARGARRGEGRGFCERQEVREEQPQIVGDQRVTRVRREGLAATSGKLAALSAAVGGATLSSPPRGLARGHSSLLRPGDEVAARAELAENATALHGLLEAAEEALLALPLSEADLHGLVPTLPQECPVHRRVV